MRMNPCPRSSAAGDGCGLESPQFLQPSGVGNPLGALRRERRRNWPNTAWGNLQRQRRRSCWCCCASRPMASQQQPMIAHLRSNPKTPEKAFQYFEKITKIVYNQGPFGVFRPFKWIWFTVGLEKPTPRSPSALRTWTFGPTRRPPWRARPSCWPRGPRVRFMPHGRAGFQTCQTIARLAAPRRHHHGHLDGKRAEGGIYNERFRFSQDDFIHEH